MVSNYPNLVVYEQRQMMFLGKLRCLIKDGKSKLGKGLCVVFSVLSCRMVLSIHHLAIGGIALCSLLGKNCIVVSLPAHFIDSLQL